jgi:hypothetical protein
MFGNPYRQEKNDGADEAWMEGTGGPLLRGRRRKRRQTESPGVSISSLSSSGSAADSNLETTSANAEVTSPARPLPESQVAEGVRGGGIADESKPNERPSDLRGGDSPDAAPAVDPKGLPAAPDIEMADGSTDTYRNSYPSGADKQGGPTSLESLVTVERLDQPSTEIMTGPERPTLGSDDMARSLRKRKVVVCTPSGAEKDRDEVIKFLLTIVKALRYSKASNTEKVSS